MARKTNSGPGRARSSSVHSDNDGALHRRIPTSLARLRFQIPGLAHCSCKRLSQRHPVPDMSVASRAARSLLVAPRTLSSQAAPLFLTTHRVAAPRGLSTTAVVSDDASSKAKSGLLSSLLHGSASAKEDGLTAQSHSKRVGRGKYIHEIQRHVVRPDKVEEYISLLAQHYPKLAADESVPCRLIGSWQVHIGELETFYHIWEYDGYGGYDACDAALSQSQEYKSLTEKVRTTLSSRSNWLTQEFAFWETAPPHTSASPNPLYELRTYHLKPGMLLEWEANWRRGLEARKRFVEPIAAYFSQIGQLHTVQHIWRYDSLEQRKTTRDAAWQVETWNDTVTKTVKLIDKMHAQIMKPLPWSPLK